MEALAKIAAEAEGSSELTISSANSSLPVLTSRMDRMKLALGKFALLRGEVMSAPLLESYSKALTEKFNEDADTFAVLEIMVSRARGEYEPKIPERGDLIDSVKRYRGERRQREEQAKANVAWEAHKAKCRREWEEEQARPREKTEDEKRLDAILAAARGDKRAKSEGDAA